MVRPGSWIEPAGVSPARVVAGVPGSRPRFVVERRRAERGVESLFGGSKLAVTRLLAAEQLVEAGRRAEADRQLERALAFYRAVGATAIVRRAETLLAAVS